MATNSFFSRHTTNEQRVVEDLTIEAIKIHGQDMVYMPRKYLGGTAMNDIFGEDPISKFDDSRTIEMYIDTVDGFEGDGDFLSKFGLEIRDSCTLIVSKKRFIETFSYRSEFDRPQEGDLIYFPLTKKLFEITFVEHENPFYQVGKLHTYKFTCQLFRYNDETIDTGNSEIDKIEDDFSYQYAMALTTGTDVQAQLAVGGHFIADETISQTQTNGIATATVLKWVTGTSTVTIKDLRMTGTVQGFKVGDDLVVGSNGAKWLVESGLSSFITGNNPLTFPTDGGADNLTYESLADDLFDFSDQDPFSEGNY